MSLQISRNTKVACVVVAHVLFFCDGCFACMFVLQLICCYVRRPEEGILGTSAIDSSE